jgi:chemotaxis signal transduction protein/CheY-like chemotaxis protein/ABC-type nitrate/sulfonate/bicarbonate transport system substrate-binding protein
MSEPLQIKILLVEDAPTMRRMEVKILSQIGFTDVIEAQDGEDAIKKFTDSPDIQLVISDWAMPHKDGKELLIWIRGNDILRQLPFIMATGQGDKQHVQEALDAGASAVVAKPFSPDELKNRIHEIFGVKSTTIPASQPVQSVTTDGRRILRVAHIQITDHLALGVLKHHLATGVISSRTYGLETSCLPNWNMVQDSLEKGEVDAACILAPAAMDLFNYGVPLQLVLFTHRNGSVMVRTRSAEYNKPYQQFFKHKTFLIPYKMSIHNMLAHKYFTEMGLRPGISGKEAVNVLFDVVAPINMPEFMAESPAICGFMVAEPIGSRAVAAGIAERQALSSEIWDNHPCCVLVFRRDFIDKHTDTVYEFTEQMMDAGRFITDNPSSSAEIAVSFLDPQKKLGLNPTLIQKVLTEPKGIRTDNLYPTLEDLEIMQRYMTSRMNIGAMIDLEKFVDLRFAEEALKRKGLLPGKRTTDEQAITVSSAADFRKEILPSAAMTADHIESKIRVSREGKYLVFRLADERFGLSIMDVREIIRMMTITPMVRMPDYVKGVINLRNKVIPIVDLRTKFGLPQKEYDERTCIIVVEVASVGGSCNVGVVVDSVSEVCDITDPQVQDTPDFGTTIDIAFILGVAKLSQGVTLLLDIEHILNK